MRRNSNNDSSTKNNDAIKGLILSFPDAFMTDVMTSDVRSELESRLHHGHGDSEPLTTWGQVFLITLLI